MRDTNLNNPIVDMGVVSHFMFWPFTIGLIVGLIMVYSHVVLPMDRVPKWPHPSNVGEVIYKDKNGLCFKFEAEVMDCGSADAKGAKAYPYVV